MPTNSLTNACPRSATNRAFLATVTAVAALSQVPGARADCGDPPLRARTDSSNNALLLRVRTSSEFTILSDQGRRYRILVSSPRGPIPAGGFPVIYILDADAWFGLAVEIAKMREYEKLAPPIVVGIASPSHLLFDPKGRSLDFTPPGAVDDVSAKAGFKLGGADQFLSFLNETLKPRVRKMCRINPSSETIFGHSLGGLFVLYTKFKAPGSFNTYLAASPSIWFSNKIVLKVEPAFETNPTRRKVRALITVGEFESNLSSALESDYRRYYSTHPEVIPGQTVSEAIAEMRKDSDAADMVGDAHGLAERLVRSGAKATFAEFTAEEHLSAAVSALNRGIPFALRPDVAERSN